MKLDRKTFIGEAVAASLFPSIGASASGVGGKWFRGNIHTHTLVSDGRAFPLEAALLYKKTGYDFLMFSDHNAVHDREMWITERNHHRHTFLEANARRFAAAFPDCKPQVRTEDDGSRAWRYGPFGETAADIDNDKGKHEEGNVIRHCCDGHGTADAGGVRRAGAVPGVERAAGRDVGTARASAG